MSAKPKIDARASPTPLTPTVVLATYLEWLNKQPLADNTQRTYRVRVTQYGSVRNEVGIWRSGQSSVILAQN